MDKCRVSLDEIQHDARMADLAASINRNAVDDLKKVEAAARMLMNGVAIFDMREVWSGPVLIERKPVRFTLSNVSDMVSEELSTDLVKQLYAGSQKGIFQMQKLIGDCAHKVAFDAMNLWGSYSDYSDLVDAAEEL